MHKSSEGTALISHHLDAAYNLALWLLGVPQDARDAVRDSTARAARDIDKLRQGNAKPWFLAIVRDTCFAALGHARRYTDCADFDDEVIDARSRAVGERAASQRTLDQKQLRMWVDAAIRGLPPSLREVIVLREFEDLKVSEISQIVVAPIDAVLARLAQAREQLRAALEPTFGTPGTGPTATAPKTPTAEPAAVQRV